jgi:rfaE bifunctional protein nucleotidyltransferase chain/domain
MNAELIKRIVREASYSTALTSLERYTDDPEDAGDFSRRVKEIGCRVVLTQGTFDLIHIGHARYAREARNHGDILIVGVDDDEKARKRKGENRPVVPLVERAEMLSHLRYVDLVVLKRASDPKWSLISLIRPDVLVAVEGTYESEEIAEISKFCGEVKVLPRQAETSTSAKVRKLVLDGAENLTRELVIKMPEFVRTVYEGLKKGTA